MNFKMFFSYQAFKFNAYANLCMLKTKILEDKYVENTSLILSLLERKTTKTQKRKEKEGGQKPIIKSSHYLSIH